MYKFAYVGIIGRANAGKSTLLNTLIGAKIAITSSKPQTTRNNIFGIYTTEKEQLVFVDTPGIHRSANHLDKYMMKNVRSALEGVDVVLYLVDSSLPTEEEEKAYIEKLKAEDKNLIVVHTKCDKKQVSDIESDIKISVNDLESVKRLMTKILERVEGTEEKNFLFAEDEITDKSVRFIIAEYIREATLKNLGEEIPHGIAVEITTFKEKAAIVSISADIICERQTHKGMIIGKGGAKLKKIGAQARLDAEKLLDKKVFLELFVKVVEDWRNKPNKFSGFGY